MIIRKANPKDIEQYTSLLQQTYQATYVDTAIGLTTDCFSKEVFNSDDTQQYLKATVQTKKLRNFLFPKSAKVFFLISFHIFFGYFYALIII
jgi:hypothetical protein